MEDCDVRKAGQAQAGRECADGEQDAAEEGFRARAKDIGAGKRHSLTLDSLGYLGASERIASRCVLLYSLNVYRGEGVHHAEIGS